MIHSVQKHDGWQSFQRTWRRDQTKLLELVTACAIVAEPVMRQLRVVSDQSVTWEQLEQAGIVTLIGQSE